MHIRGRYLIIVLIVAMLWGALWADLSIRRHDAFQTNAFDLGYVSQMLWYTIHGQPYRFTTIDGLPVSPEGTLHVSLLRRPHSLLAFHVEPILMLVAPIFALWPDPRILLILQGFGLAAGALTAAILARVRLRSGVAGVVFGLAFLLSPSVAAADLSDFHGVSLGASLLMTSLCLFATGQRRWGFAAAILAAIAREDASMLLAAVGAYLYLRELNARRSLGFRTASAPSASQTDPEAEAPKVSGSTRLRLRLRLPSWLTRVPGLPPVHTTTRPPFKDAFDGLGRGGFRLFVGSAGWTLIAFGLIIPFFNGTIGMLRRGGHAPVSVFWDRYAWLGSNPLVAIRNVVLEPGLWIHWFAQGDVQAYLATLLLSGGLVAILAPDILLVTAPIVLQDALSAFPWMRSGGAHYSVMIIPVLIFAGIEGTSRAFALIDRWRSSSAPGFSRMVARSTVLGVVVLAAVGNHAWLVASPLVPGYTWPTPNAHDKQVTAVLATIPPGASVSATSAAYPHIATRAKAYWFPSVQDAAYVAIDAARATDPVGPRELRDDVTGLIDHGNYHIASVAPGFLLLQRVTSTSSLAYAADQPITTRRPLQLPHSFDEFALATPAEVSEAHRDATATFGSSLHLIGERTDRISTLTVFGPSAVVTTYWQLTQPVSSNLQFVFYLARRSDGAIIGTLRDQAPEPIWYPTSKWSVGETIRMRITLPQVRDLQAVGVGVIDPGDAKPLQISASVGSALWNGGTAIRIVRLK